MDLLTNSYRRFLQGDETGLEEIVHSCRDGLMLYLNGFVNDLCVAEELTEETFVKLVIKRPKFSGDSAFRTWLYAIGANLTRDHLRKRKMTLVSLEDCAEIRDSVQELEKACIHREEERQLHRVMEKLKPEYRQVLWLSYFEGFSHKEIGKIMKKSTHNIETLVYRARLALKEKLLEEGFVYENL